MRLLLLSNSGSPFLQWALPTIDHFLGPLRRVGYLTAARIGDADAVYQRAAAALAQIGVETEHLEADPDLTARIRELPVVFSSGGNSYALTARLHAVGAMSLLAERVRAGMPYIGTSAGSNIAGPTILATNDWNVVAATRFDAMGHVPWVINPHYLELDPAMAPGSETRDMRIGEFLQVNRQSVLGIEEATGIRVEEGRATVVGSGRVRLFRHDAAPVWFDVGASLALNDAGGTA